MKKLLGLFVMLFLFSCDAPVDKIYHSDKIYLRQLVNTTVSETYTHGSFFLVAGSITSESTTETVIKLMGKIDDEYRFIQFDFERARIKIDNSVKTPYIVLNYKNDREISIDEQLKNMNWYGVTVTIVCPEQYLPEKLLPIQI
jgi:hypothetical protein